MCPTCRVHVIVPAQVPVAFIARNSADRIRAAFDVQHEGASSSALGRSSLELTRSSSQVRVRVMRCDHAARVCRSIWLDRCLT
jgi:hypothetical protein